ncbi:542_t:CDS:2, partial [Entrophospora sp. SA101]
NGSLVRNPPLFPPTLWSVHGLVEHGHPRLQNTVEAWNHQWNTLIGRAHQLENIGSTLFL